MPEIASATPEAGLASTDPVIAGANQLEVVEVVEHWNILRTKFPQDRRR
jgi:hypothetical protein